METSPPPPQGLRVGLVISAAVQRRLDGLQPAALGRSVERRQAVRLFGRHPEGRVDHAQRVEDALLQEFVERLPGGQLDDVAQHVDGDAVAEGRAGVEGQRQPGRAKACIHFFQHRLGFLIHALPKVFAVELVQGGMLVEAVAEAAGCG